MVRRGWSALKIEQEKALSRRYHTFNNKNIRNKILDHYGRKCACCGETMEEFLTIDHINGGGGKHIRTLGGGTSFYRWLIASDFPEGFQVLCYNCNLSKGRYGYCPHRHKNHEEVIKEEKKAQIINTEKIVDRLAHQLTNRTISDFLIYEEI